MDRLVEPPFIRKADCYDTDAASDASGLDCSVEPDMTKQSFKEEVDINTIVHRFGLSGKLPTGMVMPTFQDFEGIFDFQSAMNALNDATDRFMQLPAKVRARFENDPHQFVAFCSDEANREEAKSLGLISKEQAALAAANLAAAAPAAPATAPAAAPAASSTVST